MDKTKIVCRKCKKPAKRFKINPLEDKPDTVSKYCSNCYTDLLTWLKKADEKVWSMENGFNTNGDYTWK